MRMLPIPTLPFSLVPILFLTAIFYLNFVSRVILGPLLPVLEGDLGLRHGGAGSLFLFSAFGYSVGLLGSGHVSARLTHRHAITLSSIAVGVALLVVSWSTSVAGLRAGLVLLGISAGLYLPSGVATLTEQIRQPHWGKALAIHEFAPNLAYISSPLLAEGLLRIVSWRGVLAVVGAAEVLLGFLFLRLGRGGGHRGEPMRAETASRLLHDPSLWIMAAMFVVGIGASMGVYLMLPLFLVTEIGMDREVANSLIGFSRMAGLTVIFFSGLVTDRIGYRPALALFLGATGALTVLLGLAHGMVVTPALVFLQSVCAGGFFPAAFSLVSFLFATRLRNLAVSLVVVAGTLAGAGAIPTGIGYFAEAFSFSSAIILTGLLTLAAVPLLLRVKASGDDVAGG
ncbi:MAG TPA: MFS transporter [Candidatus Methylomirabilis sp.]|nr:MFS transporter [Candidatus Methylomirabilis sp.]